jgi:hypothetical protein
MAKKNSRVKEQKCEKCGRPLPPPDLALISYPEEYLEYCLKQQRQQQTKCYHHEEVKDV